jgi:hypothetical protein
VASGSYVALLTGRVVAEFTDPSSAGVGDAARSGDPFEAKGFGE